MNAEGQVFGISQKSSGIDTVTTCYAAGAAFAMAQKSMRFLWVMLR